MAVNLSTASAVSVGHSQMVKWNQVWTIDNFSFYYAEQKEIRSITCSKNGFEWYCNLAFYIPGEYKTSFTVRFNVMNTTKPETSVRCQFSILNSKDEKEVTAEVRNMYQNYFTCPIGYLLGKPTELLSNDTLRIYCEIIACDLSYQQVMNDVEVPRCRLSDDYRLLFNTENFSDVILSAKGTEFQAHKLILAARSSVFQAMFKHQMKESKHNRVDIIDIKPEVLQELLRFIYTDEVMDLEKMASDLLFAADKYALDRLRAMCEKELCSKLLIKNVLQLLMLADRHNAKQLKAKAIGFFKMHTKEVMKISEWKDVVRLPHLIDELLRE